MSRERRGSRGQRGRPAPAAVDGVTGRPAPPVAALGPGRRGVPPGRLVAGGFAVAIAVGTALLTLPVATPGPGSAGLLTALFTATSAVCVTGLVVVDTGTAWTGFGQAVITVLVQLGGLGILTAASLVTLLVFARLGLRTRLLALAELGTPDLGSVRALVRRIVLLALAVEAVVAVVLAARFASRGEPLGQAVWSGVFHSVMAFNNAGFALYADSLTRYAGDPLVLLPVAAGVVVGGLGYPVLFEVWRERRRPGRWSLHTRLTLAGSAALLLLGWVGVLALEWSGALGGLGAGAKVLSALFSSVNPRTAGFQVVDYAEAQPATLLLTDVLMLIGGGAASTAGGIGVATALVLAAAVRTEARGDGEVTVWRRSLPSASVRQALVLVVLGLGLVVLATGLLLVLAPVGLDAALFEVTSAVATVGLSTGITGGLPAPAQVLLVVLMYVGRLGPLAVASALLLREARVRYRLPEERVLLG